MLARRDRESARRYGGRAAAVKARQLPARSATTILCAAQIDRIENQGSIRAHSRTPHESGLREDGSLAGRAASRTAAARRRRCRQRVPAGIGQRLPRYRCVARPPAPERCHAPALVAARSRSVASRRHLGRARSIVERAMGIRRRAHGRCRNGAGSASGRGRSPFQGQRLGRRPVAGHAEAGISRQRARLHGVAIRSHGSRRVQPASARVHSPAGDRCPRSDELLPDEPGSDPHRLRVRRDECRQRHAAVRP